MRTELPAERLQRRLTTAPDLRLHAESGAAESGADPHDDRDDDPNSLLPRWLSEAGDGSGLLSRVRADPGRAGAIALAVVAALAVLVTAFTLLHDRPAPVMSAKLPAVEHVSGSSGASPGSSASPAAAAGPDRPVVVSVVGLVHTSGLFTLAPAPG